MNVDKQDSHTIAKVYMLLARSFSYPKDNLWKMLTDGILQNLLKDAVRGLPFAIVFKELPKPSLHKHKHEFENEYINSFELGFGGNMPAPLYEGICRNDEGREGIMTELLRFYDYFDVKLQEKERDFPDHLTTELEFMAYLSEKESAAIEGDKEPEYYCHAQLDFLERHLGKWIHLLGQKIQKSVKESFYVESSLLIERFINGHLMYLKNKMPELGGMR